MSTLASIRVAYGRKMQPAPYESADASVELTLTFEPGETPDPSGRIDEAFELAVGKVHGILNLGAPRKTQSAPAVKASGDVPPAKKATPAPEPEAAPVQEPDPLDEIDAATEVKTYTQGDLMAAITTAMERLKASGDPDARGAVAKIIAGYLPNATKPKYADIPQTSWGDFISDLNKLGRK